MHTQYFPFLLNVTILLVLLLIMHSAASWLFLTEYSAVYELSLLHTRKQTIIGMKFDVDKFQLVVLRALS